MEENELYFRYAKLIEENLKSEAEAVAGYIPILEILEQIDNEEDRDIITEIIQDELDHQNKLQYLFSKLTGIKDKGE